MSPSFVLIGAALSAMGMVLPEASIKSVLLGKVITWPLSSTSLTGLFRRLPSWWLTRLKTSSKGLPMAFSLLQPVIFSAMGFIPVILSCGSVETTPSPMELRVTFRSSFSSSNCCLKRSLSVTSKKME